MPMRSTTESRIINGAKGRPIYLGWCQHQLSPFSISGIESGNILFTLLQLPEYQEQITIDPFNKVKVHGRIPVGMPEYARESDQAGLEEISWYEPECRVAV